MKRIIGFFVLAAGIAACTGDDEYTIDHFVGNDTISIVYHDQAVTIGPVADFVQVDADGADVVVRSNTSKHLVLRLSGSTTDGSLLVYSQKKYTLLLAGIDMTHADGPAINNQCGKSLYVVTAPGSINTLTDGSAYTERDIDQKATLFSEGQLFFRGSGTLNINALAKNAIASDDYVVFDAGVVNVNVAATGSHGVKAKDSVLVNGGTIGIAIASNGCKGIKSDGTTTILGGNITISTTGDAYYKTESGTTADDEVEDDDNTSSCAGIKSDSTFVMRAGVLTITSSGDGGKGINCSQDILFEGGTLSVTTTGTKKVAKPKAVKSETAIVVSGGSFEAVSNASKACDNAGSDAPQIVGTPAEKVLTSHRVVVKY